MSRVNEVTQTMNRSRPSFLRTPKGYVLLVIILLSGIAALGSKDFSGFTHIGIAVSTTVLLDLLFAMGQNRHRIFPDGAVITGLIIGVVLSPAAHWYVTVLAAALAMGSKHILKIKRKPIFNPAAFGLGAASFLSAGQSWWGALPELPAWCIVFMLVGGFVVTKRINKFPQVFVFLGVYFIALLFMALFNIGDAFDALRTPYVNAALFLAFFMLTDPPTSPAKYKSQIIFGIITAVIALFVYVKFGWLGYLLIGLLTANLWSAIKK
jgi:enediyne biosynthesis protein E5